ncbi:MAG: ATP-dependent Clp protease ATP-binding subunit, partial [Betaproteobacteria bacterium]
GRRVQNVKPGDPYEEVEARVRVAIGEHFKFRLMRPEILNRIGDNIVVFDFIRPAVAQSIFEGMLANVLARARAEHAIEIQLDATVSDTLRELCTADLSHGGRGIGNQLESVFVNPLARALFTRSPEAASEVRVTHITQADRVWTLRLA